MTDVERIDEEAAGWVERMDRAVVDTVLAARFDRWMEADHRHQEAFARLHGLWQSDALAAALTAALESDQPSSVESAPAHRPRRRLWRGGLVAGGIAAGLLLVLTLTTATTYRTAVGDGARFTLADGSQVDLGGNAEMSARILPWSRSVTLARGEAFFDVRHEARRSFSVHSGDATVRVLGTAFNVDRQAADRVVVQVYRGAVELRTAASEPSILHKGSAARVTGGTIVAEASPPSAEPEWKTGWFDASAVPLQVLVDKLNAHSRRQIAIVNPALPGRKVTGRFHVADPPSVLRALEALYDVRAVATPEGFVLR